MRFLYLSCVGWALGLGLTFAQPADAQPGVRNVPSVVQKAFTERFGPTGPATTWDRERGNIWQAAFRLTDGTAASARFDREGHWLETTRRVSAKELPAGARSYVLTHHPKKKIRGTALVTRADDSKLWKVSIDGQRLFFDHTGHFLHRAPARGTATARTTPRHEKKATAIPVEPVNATPVSDPAATQAVR